MLLTDSERQRIADQLGILAADVVSVRKLDIKSFASERELADFFDHLDGTVKTVEVGIDDLLDIAEMPDN